MAKLNIDIDYIAQLAELLQRTGLNEIEISEDDARIRVAKTPPQVTEVQTIQASAAPVAQPATIPQDNAPSPAAANDPVDANALTSPMVGTVYMAPEPGAPNFVRVGDRVEEGDTLLIIEAMKVMNAIRAPRSGKITQIFVENASPVEYGEPLLVIE